MKTICLAIFLILFADNSFAQFEYTRSLVEVNSAKDVDAYPWLSHDGNRIYFTKESEDGNDRIVMVSKKRGEREYGNLIQLDFNFPKVDNLSCWFSKDEMEVYFSVRERDTLASTSTSIFYSKRENLNSSFSEPQKLTLNGSLKGFISAPSLTPDNSQMFLYNNSGHAHSILIFEKLNPLEFNLIGKVPFDNSFDPKPGQLSKDGLKYLVSDHVDESELFYVERNSLDEPFSPEIKVMEGITNDSTRLNSQPSISANEDVIVYVRGGKTWGDNDLYISFHESALSDKTNSDVLGVSLYPNPAFAFVNVELDGNEFDQIMIFNTDGKLVLEKRFGESTTQAKFDVSIFQSGIYFCNIRSKSGVDTTVKFFVK